MSFELYERLRFRSAMTSELASLADILGANTAVSLTFNDSKSAGEALAALRAEHHIVAACLYDLRGAVLAEYRREGVVLICKCLHGGKTERDLRQRL